MKTPTDGATGGLAAANKHGVGLADGAIPTRLI